MTHTASFKILACISIPSSLLAAGQTYQDTPFPQARAVLYRNEVGLAGYDLRTVRADRDGKVLVNTNKGLLRAFDGRLVPWRELAAIEKHDHLDLELLRGRFIFLTGGMLLPLHGAGVDWRDNRKTRFTRVTALGPGRYLLLSTDSIVETGTAPGGGETALPNPGYREMILDRTDDSVVLWAAHRLARYRNGTLIPQPVPPTRIAGVVPIAPGVLAAATDNGLFRITADAAAPLPRRLPVTELTCIAVDAEGRLWIGSTRGAFRLDKTDRIQYYAGKRWLPNDRVIDIFIDTRNDVYVLTAGGLSRLSFPLMTLADKAEEYLTNLRLHHIRYGMVSEAQLLNGDYATVRNTDCDNDGLWSSIYLAAEAYRYAVTRHPSARENVLDGLDALERLVTITGIPGFQARSFELAGFKVSDPLCWRSRPAGDFEWKGTTSSDEIVGTFYFYSVFHETVANEDPALRKRVASIVGAIMDHILDHRFYLVDIDGRPTQWGRWNPEYVNTPAVGGDRRLNSIEILSFLQLAYALTQSPRYKDAFYDLVRNHGYAENTVKYLPNPLGEWNHSDDELYWLSYHNLLKHGFDGELKKTFLQSAREHYDATKRKRNPLWNFIYGAITGERIDLDGAIAVLREFPLDRRDWRMENSHRNDITIERRPDCEPEATRPLSFAERHVHKWNANELTPDGGDRGDSPESGAEFLLPYWLGRYAGYIVGPKEGPSR